MLKKFFLREKNTQELDFSYDTFGVDKVFESVNDLSKKSGTFLIAYFLLVVVSRADTTTP